MIWLLTDVSAGFLSTMRQAGLLAAAGHQAESGKIIIGLLIAGVVVAAVVGGVTLAVRASHRRRTSSHAGLFAGLCQHHNLDRSSRNLLKALGQAHHVRYAARVFLDPALFEPKRLPPSLRSRQAEILALRQQLFLVTEETTASP